MTFFTLDDDEVPLDTREVLAASGVLQITEFRLFELAYERWFGKAARADEIEPAFTVYMFRDVVPHWVRKYARDVIESERCGTLEPTQFGVFPRDDGYSAYGKMVRFAMVLSLIALALLAVGMLVGHYTGYEGGPA